MALFDITASLHEYYADLTRVSSEIIPNLLKLQVILEFVHERCCQTIALPDSRIPSRKLQLWYTVLAAQTAAFAVAEEGTPASEVDSAARVIIDVVGAGDYFTHRLGHGKPFIPLEAESMQEHNGLTKYRNWPSRT